jgi:DNA-binding XRE family transcriptional regulator
LARDFAEDTSLRKLGEAAANDAVLPATAVRRIVVGGESAVKVVRELRGLSQRELAERAGSSSAYISQIENGRPAGRAMLSKLSKILAVPIDTLVND